MGTSIGSECMFKFTTCTRTSTSRPSLLKRRDVVHITMLKCIFAGHCWSKAQPAVPMLVDPGQQPGPGRRIYLQCGVGWGMEGKAISHPSHLLSTHIVSLSRSRSPAIYAQHPKIGNRLKIIKIYDIMAGKFGKSSEAK
jgi:hypothetical protein